MDAEKLIEWIEAKLRVPSGPLRGKPFALGEWQKDYLRGALAGGVRESGLSVARKNGKSGLIAALLLACLESPQSRPDWRGVVASLTGALAAELRLAIQATADISGIDLTVRLSPAPGRLAGKRGTRLDFLAADKATGHAIGVDLAVIDEAGLLDESQRSLWNALLSAVSGRDGRLICISVQGDSPMFRELEDRKAADEVHWVRYSAPVGLRLDDPAAWSEANPGLAAGLKSERYMADMAKRALAAPANQSAFRALDLNQSVDPAREMIVGVSDWLACYGDAPRSGKAYIGLDLGGSASMTAAAIYWPESGRLEVTGAFANDPDLAARGSADGVGNRYEQMRERGEIITYPGRVTSVSRFLDDLADRLGDQHVAVLGADRYRKAEALQHLDDAGLRWPVEFRGAGASASADGSHDVRAFQDAIMSRKIRTAPSLLMESAIADSAIQRDQQGNPALDKARARGRIDALSAAVIAVGLGSWDRVGRDGLSYAIL